MFMTALGALHREKAEHRARQGNLFSNKSMTVLLGAPMTNSSPEPEAPSVADTPGPGQVSWAGPCPSARGIFLTLVQHAPQVEGEVSGFFLPGNTQHLVPWTQLVPAIC